MCEFLSFLIHKNAGAEENRDDRIVCGNLRSHSGSHEVLKTKATDWREAEWVRDGDDGLTVRTSPDDEHDGNWYKAIIIATYPTRQECIIAMVKYAAECGGSLYLSGCDLKGITLPQSVGGYLDLSGCDLKGITLPQSVGGSLYLSGCDQKEIAAIRAMKKYKVYA